MCLCPDFILNDFSSSHLRGNECKVFKCAVFLAADLHRFHFTGMWHILRLQWRLRFKPGKVHYGCIVIICSFMLTFFRFQLRHHVIKNRHAIYLFVLFFISVDGRQPRSGEYFIIVHGWIYFFWICAFVKFSGLQLVLDFFGGTSHWSTPGSIHFSHISEDWDWTESRLGSWIRFQA